MTGLECVDGICTALCGNGVVDPEEECDDGNNLDDHDGCTDQCLFSVRAQSVFAGDNHTCALFHSGQVMCWGLGFDGRLGYGSEDNIGDNEHPWEVGFVRVDHEVVQLALGLQHTCALRTDGNVICWGRNGNHGPLGQGTAIPANEDIGDDGDPPSEYAPIDLGMPAKALSVGNAHTCAILTNNRVTCWGRGLHGRLGYGNEDNIGNDESPVVAGEVQTGADVAQIAAGGSHTCALLDDATVRCWGDNTFGQLGYPNIVNVGAIDLPTDHGPVQFEADETPVLLGVGRNHTCVVLHDSRVRCWGQGGQGRLGYGDNENVGSISPITDREPVVVAEGAEIVDISLGVTHTCVATATGEVYCWGTGTLGGLGQGSSENLLSPPKDPVNLGEGRSATQVVTGEEHTCVRLADSHVMCWGRGDFGKLGYANENNIGDSGIPAEAGTVMLE